MKTINLGPIADFAENTNKIIFNAYSKNGFLMVDIESVNEFNPADGDYLVSEIDNGKKIFILKRSDSAVGFGCYIGLTKTKNSNGKEFKVWTENEDDYEIIYNCRYASNDEINEFNDLLKNEYNKRWDKDFKKLIKIKFIPKERESYYFLDESFSIGHDFNYGRYEDILRINGGNCYKTLDEVINVKYKIND